MKLSRTSIELLRILIDKNTFINLNEITKILGKFKLTPRTIQKEMKKLIDSNRVIVRGQASTTEYAINEIQSTYRKYEFLFVIKGDEIAGLLFKLKNIYRFKQKKGRG